MRQDWEPEDLIEVWTLLEDDLKRVRNKSGATGLGFALLLKFFEVEARFPESAKEVPAAAVEYVAQQVKVPAGAWAEYDWQSKAIQRHRGEIRAAYGFRANTEEDQDRLAAWLATELCPVELSRDRLAAAVVARCRNDHVEPPAPGQVGRLVGKAVKDFEKRFCRSTLDRLSHATRSRLEDLIAGDGSEQGAGGDGAAVGGGRSHFTELKTDPGAPGLESMLAEVNKLERVRRLELPADLFADVSEKLAGAGIEGVPGEPGADEAAAAPDAAGHVVPCATDGDHRLAGGPVHPARVENQHEGGAEGREGAGGGAEEGPGQGGDAAAGRGGGPVRAVRHGTAGDLPGRAGSSASRTSCACSYRCGTRCAEGRSGWWARTGGETRRTTCPPTSRTTGTSTTRPWASRRTPVSSSPP
ncbi:DUF4158 domain-containing protein [Streptomyces albidoflavus]